MVNTFDLTNTPGAGRQGWQLRLPFPRIRRNPDDSSVHDMGVHHTTAAAIVAASAGHNVLARTRSQPWLFVDGTLHLLNAPRFRHSAACVNLRLSATYIAGVRINIILSANPRPHHVSTY